MDILGFINGFIKNAAQIKDAKRKAEQQQQEIDFTKEQQKFNARITEAELAQAKREANQQQRGRNEGRAAFAQGSNYLQNLESYDIDDLYKRIEIGDGPDNLNRYQVGKKLQQQLLNDSAYQKIARDHRLTSGEDENLNLLKQLRDAKVTPAESLRQNALIRKQRDADQTLQNTITKRAIESGRNPHRAKLTERLIASQNNANRNNALTSGILSDAASRQLKAADSFQSGLNNAFDRRAQIASAQDAIERTNTEIRNATSRDSLDRNRFTLDKNTSVQNKTQQENQNAYLKALRDTKDSRNTKRRNQADLLVKQGQKQYSY